MTRVVLAAIVISLAACSTESIKQATEDLRAKNEANRQERLAKQAAQGDVAPAASATAISPSTSAGKSRSFTLEDSRKWNILGAKLDSPPDEAIVAVKQAFPRALRVDSIRQFDTGHFKTPRTLFGTELVAGDMHSSVVDNSPPTAAAIARSKEMHGAKELNGDAEQIRLSYAFPGAAKIISVQRFHRYVSRQTAPSIDAVEQELIGKFGAPSYSTKDPGTSMLGSGQRSFWDTSPSLIWVWAYSNKVDFKIEQQRNLCLGAAESVASFAYRGTVSIQNGTDGPCDRFFYVEATISDKEYVSSLKQILMDQDAYLASSNALRDYVQSGNAAGREADKKKADQIKPKL